MNNENTVTLFPCQDAAVDGCPNDTSAPDTHCADCHLFHEEMAKGESLLMDESWKPVDDERPLIGFETVELEKLPDPPAEIIVPNVDNHYVMNAAEVDAQAALYEIAAVLAKYQNTLKQIDTALASYGVN